jgi:hypothetical protein
VEIVPGRKTDINDATRLADLLAHARQELREALGGRMTRHHHFLIAL